MDIRIYSSAFIVNDKNELLLVKEGKPKNYNLWNLPGGHVEVNEAYVDAAIRETKEETGLDVRLSHLLSIFTGSKHDSIHFVYYSNVYFGEILRSDPDILDVMWFPLDEFSETNLNFLHPYKFKENIFRHKNGKLINLDIILPYPSSKID